MPPHLEESRWETWSLAGGFRRRGESGESSQRGLEVDVEQSRCGV